MYIPVPIVGNKYIFDSAVGKQFIIKIIGVDEHNQKLMRYKIIDNVDDNDDVCFTHS